MRLKHTNSGGQGKKVPARIMKAYEGKLKKIRAFDYRQKGKPPKMEDKLMVEVTGVMLVLAKERNSRNGKKPADIQRMKENSSS